MNDDRRAAQIRTLRLQVASLKREVRAARKRAGQDSLRTRTAEFRRASAALAQSEERFRQMAENIREVFWLANVALNRILYVSPAFEAIWGQPCERLYANPKLWFLAIHPDDRAKVGEAFIKNRDKGEKHFEAEYRIIRPDGSIRWIRDRGWVVRNKAGKAYRLAGVAHDITERMQLQAEIENVCEMERQRLGADLHDGLSQHMAAITLLGETLAKRLEKQGSPEAAGAAKLARFAREAIDITHDLSRSLYPACLHISGLPTALKELATLIGRMFPISCQFRNHGGAKLADANLERQIYRIAREAAFNAARHSHGRHVRIQLRQTGQSVTLGVHDDGVGTAGAKMLPADMGLHIMRYRAEMIGASLSIRPRPNGGTSLTCRVKLPDI